jgi:hypothetical protein
VEAEGLGGRLLETSPDTAVEEQVHHSTLKSFVKEQLEGALPLPLDLFSVQSFNKAVITLPKTAKTKGNK